MPYFRVEQLSLMAIIDILLPKMGESVAEATITKLVVDAGSEVEADDPIVEIATDKVDSEVPAPEDGTLVEWCVAEGDVVQVGAVIARYDVGGEGVTRPPQLPPPLQHLRLPNRLRRLQPSWMR